MPTSHRQRVLRRSILLAAVILMENGVYGFSPCYARDKVPKWFRRHCELQSSNCLHGSNCEHSCATVCPQPAPSIGCCTVSRPEVSLPAIAPVPKHDTKQLGSSVLGIPIIAHFFGTSGPTTLIFGGIHGDEPTTAFVTRQLVDFLAAHPEAYFENRVIVVPVANPDGLARQTRTNARQVDLNRNFPAKNFAVGKPGRYFGGEQPASEPETQVLIQLIEAERPQRIIALHSIARGRHGNNFDGPGESLARRLSEHNRYPVLPTIGYPTPGSFGSWAGNDLQIPTITLELPHGAAGETAWQENREALLAAILGK